MIITTILDIRVWQAKSNFERLKDDPARMFAAKATTPRRRMTTRQWAFT